MRKALTLWFPILTPKSNSNSSILKAIITILIWSLMPDLDFSSISSTILKILSLFDFSTGQDSLKSHPLIISTKISRTFNLHYLLNWLKGISNTNLTKSLMIPNLWERSKKYVLTMENRMFPCKNFQEKSKLRFHSSKTKSMNTICSWIW